LPLSTTSYQLNPARQAPCYHRCLQSGRQTHICLCNCIIDYLKSGWLTAAMWVKNCQHYTFCYKKLSRYLYRGVLPDKNIVSDIDGLISFEYEDSQTQSREVRTLPTIECLWLLCSRECCNMYYPKAYNECGILETNSGLLRGNCKKLRQRIQLMLAVAGAQFQVTKSPSIPEITRAIATRRCPCCQLPMRFMGIHISYRPTSSLTIA
jgi:hypothetical protein